MSELNMSWIPLTPFIFILIAAAAAALFVFGGRMKAEEASDVAFSVLMIAAGVWVVAIALQMVCLNIRPYEMFADVSGADVSGVPTTAQVNALLADISKAEKTACALITRADKFIKAGQGKAGQDNPDLVTQAQQAALTAAGGPITDCTGDSPTDVSGLAEADNRITRLETTVNGFTGPQFQTTYNKTVKCPAEGFADAGGSSLASLKSRLAAVEKAMQTQQQTLLKPIDQKTEALKKGQASDCDKQAGANTAMAKSNMPAGAST